MADRRGGNQSRLCLGACRCLGENEADRQASQKSKTLEQSKNDHTRLSSEARMMIVLIAVKSCRTPRRGRQHRRARKRGTSPSARVHRGEPLRRDIADWGMSWTRPRTRPTSTRRHAAPGDRCNPSRRVVPSGTSWPSDHPRRPPCHTPGDRIARESHCCCEPPAPKPGDVYAEGRTCLPRSRMGAVPSDVRRRSIFIVSP